MKCLTLSVQVCLVLMVIMLIVPALDMLIIRRNLLGAWVFIKWLLPISLPFTIKNSELCTILRWIWKLGLPSSQLLPSWSIKLPLFQTSTDWVLVFHWAHRFCMGNTVKSYIIYHYYCYYYWQFQPYTYSFKKFFACLFLFPDQQKLA